MSKPKKVRKPKEPELKPRARTKPKAKPKVKPRAKPKAKANPRVKPKAKPRAEPKAKPRVKPKAKPRAKPKAKPKIKPKVKSRAKPKAKPRKKAVKPVFERRPKKAPIEVVGPEPGATTQDEAWATIKARLEDARALLPEGVHGTIRVHPYADGSVDGELSIQIPEGFTAGDTAWELMDSFGNITLGQRYWVAVGSNYIIEADEQIYRRFRGMNQVQTNYQRAVRANIVEVGLILRRTIVPGMAKKHKQEAYSVFVRLHWNPKNEHPKR